MTIYPFIITEVSCLSAKARQCLACVGEGEADSLDTEKLLRDSQQEVRFSDGLYTTSHSPAADCEVHVCVRTHHCGKHLNVAMK